MGFKDVHNLFATACIVGLFLSLVSVFWRLTNIESYWLFATALITGFYFWWGYVFMGEMIYYSRTIADFFLDFSAEKARWAGPLN